MRLDRTVFVSSTFRDLEVHRRAVIDALHDPAWLKVMESRGAAAGRVADNVCRWIQESDVFLCIVGMTYGSCDSESGVSYTALEYEEAVRNDLPRLVYLIDEDRHQLSASSVDRGIDGDDLFRFKEKVRAANHLGFFRSPEHLQYQVTRDVISLFEDFGWRDQAHPSATESDSRRQIQPCGWGTPGAALSLDQLVGDDVSDAGVAAAVLVSQFAKGNYDSLCGVISLRPEIRAALRSFLAVRDIDEEGLVVSIKGASDALAVRLLVDIAGMAKASSCLDAICNEAVVRGRKWDIELRELGYPMRSFVDVCVETIGRMPLSGANVIEKHIERARESKRWQAKRALEKAHRIMTRKADREAAEQGAAADDPTAPRLGRR